MDATQLEICPLKVPFLGGSAVSYVDKEIEFVPARKRFNGLAYSNGDFKIETLNASRPPEPSSKIGPTDLVQITAKKSDAPDALESWMDQELSFRVSFQRIGAGLQNLGNTCFLNSVLQCLTYTEPLAAYLQTGKHQSSCRINGFCALCAIQKHVSRALQATGKSLAPKDLVSNLRCISRSFRNARQEDAHEYMVNLLESMHKCCLPSGVPSESPSAYEKSLVHKIFGGRLRSQVKCLQCNYCSNKFDPFIDLSLEINKADSVLKALGHFTAAEHLDGGAKQYQCQKCKEKVRALKQLTVHKAPYVLTIHLKRFHSLNPGEKINKTVRFDTKLDLKPFVSGPYEGDLKYSLYGVLVHHGGSTRSGHYLCYVRTSTNMWYLLNDNTVMQVRESSVLQQKAYMLFYIRNRDTTPRKNAEIAPKEILKEHHTLNRESSSFSQSPSCNVQFSQIMEKSATSLSSCSVVAKQMVSVHKADTIMKGTYVNCSTVFEPVPSAKEIQKPSTPTSVNIDGEHGKSAIPIAFNSKFNEHSQKDSTAPVAQSPVSNGLKVDAMMVEQRMPHENISDKINNTGSVVSGNQPSCKINKVNALKENQKVDDDDEKPTREESVVLTATMVTCTELEKIANKVQSKTKKKHTKHQFTIIHFGTNVFLRASLGPRKKLVKKKHRSSRIKKDCANSDFEPSTSESRNIDKVKSHKKRKGEQKGQKEAKTSSDEVGRTSENSAVLASESQVPKNSSSTTELSPTKAKDIETANDGKRDTMQNCFVSMLTRGIEETIVAHWDDVNTTPPTMESDTAVTSIGHVLDEWDEEYDRGKRKKIRVSQHEFGGPNLFQQVASNKLKSKKVKLDRGRSGNQPFRI